MGGLAGHRRQANIPSQEAMRISLLLCALAAAFVCGLSEEMSDDGLSELGRRAGGGALTGMLNLSPGATSNTAGNDEEDEDLGEHSCDTNTENMRAKIKEKDVKNKEKDVKVKELKERLSEAGISNEGPTVVQGGGAGVMHDLGSSTEAGSSLRKSTA